MSAEVETGTVKNVSIYPVPLASGQVLVPGETAPGVPVRNRDNARLISEGRLAVVQNEGFVAPNPKEG